MSGLKPGPISEANATTSANADATTSANADATTSANADATTSANADATTSANATAQADAGILRCAQNDKRGVATTEILSQLRLRMTGR
jgi:hypothetical protein